jgi:hypothetical protein
VALEATFEDLTSQLRKLRDILRGLSLTTGEDRSEGEAAVLVDRMNDSVVELAGWLEDALAAAKNADEGLRQSLDLNRARRQLTTSQESFQKLSETFFSELLSYDRMSELVQFGNEHGRQWMAWTSTVRQGLEGCRPQLEVVARAYFRCWQEIAERVGTSSVSLQATTIGQQITATLPAAKEIEAEGLT